MPSSPWEVWAAWLLLVHNKKLTSQSTCRASWYVVCRLDCLSWRSVVACCCGGWQSAGGKDVLLDRGQVVMQRVSSCVIISFLATFYVVNNMLNVVRYVVWWKQWSRTKAGCCTDCPLSLLLCNHLLLTFSQESHVPFNESQKYNFTICGNIFENYSPSVWNDLE